MTESPALAWCPIPATTVHLRDARRGSVRQVDLAGFEMGRTPVTVAQYQAVAGGPLESDGRLPVHPVTWLDAVDWCNRASERCGLTPAYRIAAGRVVWNPGADGIRLPTEAEWEAACRAGAASATYGPLAEVAWTHADGVTGPQPVGVRDPNAFGLYDMLGNVWEWCWDFADTGRYGPYRSLRGGGWADRPWSVRASVRRGSAPDAVLEDVGFRVARGAVGADGATTAQGWSDAEDRRRAAVSGPLPMGWTPYRELLDTDG